MVVEPVEARRRLALEFGAARAIDAADWQAEVDRWSGGKGVDAVILTIGATALIAPAIAACKPGGRVVLFAGFGSKAEATLDMNAIHYREIALIGSEWVGTPPNQRRERYDQAADLLISGEIPVDRLVTGECGFDDLEQVLAERSSLRDIKIMFRPRRAP
jgi:threonine dehydrogenase-like Zn-dependent dehydrogenase